MFHRADVKTFRGTDSKVIGSQFSGSFTELLLWIKIEAAFFQIMGISPAVQIFLIIIVKYDRRKGDFLKTIMGIWSKGQGDPIAFILCIILLISQ